MSITDFLNLLEGVSRSRDGWQARCPAHDDRRASLSVSESRKSILLHCHAGCTAEAICTAVNLPVSDLFHKNGESHGKIVVVYNYEDEEGKLLFQVCRFEPKGFRQRRPDPSAPGGWVWNTKTVRRVLFRLPQVIAGVKDGRPVYICEGEKDVLAVEQAGFVATCNPGGAGKWRKEYGESLRGADVAIIMDKDEPGRKHAANVISKLEGFAKSIRLIELPDLDGKPVKDAADYFAAGGEAADLDELTWSSCSSEARIVDGSAPRDSKTEEESEGKQKDDEKTRKSAATQLVELVKAFPFFHDAQNRAFVRVEVNGHAETWAVNSSQFRNLLAKIFWKEMHKAINRNALADAVNTLAGMACHEGPEEPVFLRVAPYGEAILIDLCDPQWRVVEVTASGWTILDRSPKAFVRTGAMRALPIPFVAGGGSLDPLWELLNVTPSQRPLVAGALLNYFHPQGPFFVLNLVGEQGSAKSCAAKIIRTLVDPSEVPLRSPPREERDLLVHAANNWCVVLDNLSSLPAWLSDGLCRLATGGGHSARQLYSDGEEFTLAVKRPAILTGIDDVATRPDLAERAMQIELETIPDHHRMTERELWRKFEAARPIIFSAILNGLSRALGELPNARLEVLPRMADPVTWATAGETAFGWKTGTFAAAYWQNLNEGAIASLEAHPVGVAIRHLLDGVSEWTGEAAQLLKALNDSAPEELRHSQNWPKSPRTLSNSLRRLAQALRRAGFELEFVRSRRRTIRLCKRGDFASPTSQPGTNDANDAKM
jgi:hypothetical protein